MKSRNTQLKGDLLFRAFSLPISRNISIPFITIVVKWVECSGQEWTVDRVKSVKLDIIRKKSGLIPVSKWIGKSTKGTFTGILGTLERMALSSEEDFHNVLQLLQVYSWFIAGRVTDRQAKKFLDGVRAETPPRDALSLGISAINSGSAKAGIRRVNWLPSAPPLVEFLPSPERRAPLLAGSVPESKGVIDSLQYIWFTNEGRAHYNRFKHLYDFVVQGLDWYNLYLQKVTGPYGPMPNVDPGFVVGRIGLIQEPGFKLRAVANPGRVFQTVLKPLGDTLYRTLKVLPWDCTFDQSKAFPLIQEKLSRGSVVHSIDLSGATDYFPLEMQLHLLRKIFTHDIVDLFSEISRGKWEMPGFGQVSWTRGQPLGLYPSFASFALTHGCLLLGLSKSHHYDDSFFVLGDDVVILDEELAHSYYSLMGALGCPISESKTLVSSKLAEFAGKVITPGRVIPQHKWRIVSDDSFIDVCRTIGHRSMRLLRTRQRSVIERLAPLPECLGGLGWNPHGLSLDSRLENAPWIWEPLQARSRITSYTGSSIRLLFESESYRQTLSDIPSLVCNLRSDLDQRSIALTEKYISGSLTPWYMILGKNLDEVLTTHLLDCDLPLEMVRNPASTLSIWERKVGTSEVS
jgi:hypothetical protein